MNLNATLIIEVFSFLILLGLLIKFLYRPVLNILDKRAEETKEANQKVQEDLAFAEKQRNQAQRILAEAKSEILKMKDKASLDADKLRQKAISQAQEETARMLYSGQQEIVQQREEAKEKIKGEIAGLSLKMAEKILRRKFRPEDQKRLIQELTKEISDGRGLTGR